MRLCEFINEAVGGNYLYHGTNTENAKKILSSGFFLGSTSAKQDASDAQTRLPTVSFSRSWQYELNPGNVGRDPYQVVFVVDRRALETKSKTFATSQSGDIRGLGWGASGDTVRDEKGNRIPIKTNQDPRLRRKWAVRMQAGRERIDTNNDGIISPEEIRAIKQSDYDVYTRYIASKAGGEFEEIVPVKNGKLPLKGILVGFWINPKTEAASDETLMNHPMRLEQTGPNTFKRANSSGDRDHTETIPTKFKDPNQRSLDKKSGREKAQQIAKSRTSN